MLVTENLLSESLYNKVVSDFKNVQWNWSDNTTFDEHNDAPSLVHTAYDYSSEYTSNFFNTAIIPLNEFCLKNSIELKQLFRIRIGLMPKWSHKITHTPHVDFITPHKTLIYYVTSNSDAETYLYKERHPGDNIMNDDEYFSPKTFVSAVKAEANKAFMFDGLIYHASNMPTKENKRIVMSYNFI